MLLSALKALTLMQQQQQQQQSNTNAPFIVEHAMPNHAVVAHQQIQSDCSDVCLSKGLCACAFLSSYEMLNMFGVYVHACVNGCFNIVVYAVLATDKQGMTLLPKSPMGTCAPRADMATFVGQCMLGARGPGPHLRGPSIAN